MFSRFLCRLGCVDPAHGPLGHRAASQPRYALVLSFAATGPERSMRRRGTSGRPGKCFPGRAVIATSFVWPLRRTPTRLSFRPARRGREFGVLLRRLLDVVFPTFGRALADPSGSWARAFGGATIESVAGLVGVNRRPLFVSARAVDSSARCALWSTMLRAQVTSGPIVALTPVTQPRLPGLSVVP
jgi:hypothetical protein